MITLSSCNIDAIACLKVEVCSTGLSRPTVAGEIGFHLAGKPFGNIRIEALDEGSDEIEELSNQLVEAIERYVAETIGAIDSDIHSVTTPQGILNKDV